MEHVDAGRPARTGSLAPNSPPPGPDADRPPGEDPAAPGSAGAAAQTPPTVVVAVRHGRTETTGQILPGRAPGLHLSSDGMTDAALAAERVARLAPIAAVYSSPLERAQETAAPIAAALGLEVTIEGDLNECDFGDWTGRRLSELAALPDWRRVQSFPSGFRFPGGESFREAQARLVAAISRLAARHPAGRVVVVSHADCIKAWLADALGVHLDLFQRIVIAPASQSVVAYHDDGPRVLAVGSTGRLEDAVGPSRPADDASAPSPSPTPVGTPEEVSRA